MLQAALALLGIFALFAVAVRGVWNVAAPVNVIAGVVSALFVLGITLMTMGPQALFWSPWFLAEGFALGFVVAWILRRLFTLRPRGVEKIR